MPILIRRSSKFRRHLNKLRKRCRLTDYGLAFIADVDPTYLRKLLTGERKKPSRRLVWRIADAILEYTSAISEKDVDKLIEYAGHAPINRRLKS